MKSTVFVSLATMVCAAPGSPDLVRARTKVPRQGFRGVGTERTAGVLNGHLEKRFQASVRPCDEWSAEELQDLQSAMWLARNHDFDAIYQETHDRRVLGGDINEMKQRWARLTAMAANDTELRDAHRDGHCYEAVMWLIHHLTTEQQAALASSRSIPGLPSKCRSCSGNAEVCRAAADQHTCMYCHSLDENSEHDIPVAEPRPGQADIYPVFPHRWIAKIHGQAFYNESGPNQSGKVSWEALNLTYYYDWANLRVRQDSVYNDTYPAKTGISWFNGSNQKWYVIDAATHFCIVLPPPILTPQRPDFMMNVGAKGRRIGAERVQGRKTHHWYSEFVRVNPFGLVSNASFDLWLDAETSGIAKLEGKCDPPDAQEGSPTDAKAFYDEFDPHVTAGEMNKHFDINVSKCVPIPPHRLPIRTNVLGMVHSDVFMLLSEAQDNASLGIII